MYNLFKIWDRTRNRKSFVLIKGNSDIYTKTVLKASELLEIDGSKLVLESDGTPITEDEVLLHLKSETLILLTKDEEWIASFSVSQNSDSTITVCSGNSYTGLSSPSSSDISLENRNVSHTDDSIDMPVSNMEYVWANFRVPWNKLPVDIFESAKAGDKSVHVKTQIVHSIIYEMRHIRKYIPAKAFKYVAKQVIEKFSETFQDIDNDGTIIGDGTHSLVCKLIDRNNYLNRPHKTGYFRKSTSPALTKRKRNCMAGCTEWESPIPEKDDIANEKAELQNCVENESYFSLLEKTYAKQREFLNNVEEPPSVYDIKREWPVIFKKSAIVWHFEKLTGTNIDKLKTSLQEKAPKIIEYGIQKKLLQLEKNLNPTYSCLQFYARSFREDISFLFYKAKDDNFCIKEVVRINSPCIVEIEKEESSFIIVFENEKVLDVESLEEALKFCLALYFILNVQYPKQISCTLEMLQRYHLKIHPDTGSKSEGVTVKRKVLNLMTRMKNI